jgi:hypothetical protein
MRRALSWTLLLAIVAVGLWFAIAPDAQQGRLSRALDVLTGDADTTDAADRMDARTGSAEPGNRNDDQPATDDGADGDDQQLPSRLERVEGLNAVRISPQEQQQTGVELLELVETTHLSETIATGRVLDIQPLVQLRTDYNTARGEEAVARAAVAGSSRAVQRLRVLNREDGNVSARQLQEAESVAAADTARAQSAARRIQDVRNQALATWGAALAEMALSEQSPAFDALVARQDVLVMVTLSPGEELPADNGFIYVGPTGERLRARKAYLLASAAQADVLAPGETYIFRTSASKLRTGMRMDAWIPRPGAPGKGVEVPGAAVIWYANKLWVYVQRDEELFVRHPLNEYEETRDGWFVTEGVKPGDRIVIRGAQMLFSEEFRSAIPSEDEARE